MRRRAHCAHGALLRYGAILPRLIIATVDTLFHYATCHCRFYATFPPSAMICRAMRDMPLCDVEFYA